MTLGGRSIPLARSPFMCAFLAASALERLGRRSSQCTPRLPLYLPELPQVEAGGFPLSPLSLSSSSSFNC